MKKRSFIIFSFLMLCGFSQAQNHKVIQKEKKTIVDNNNLTSTQSAKPASESKYYGYENQIIEFSVDNTIPTNFPTNEGYQTREAYRDAINKWMKENDSFVKPDHKNKTITD